MKPNTNEKEVDEVLSRGVEEIIDIKEFRKKLLSGKQLRIKLGIDPTSSNIHLGRSIPLLKLRDFQKMGHQIVLIIGDFTGTIGDTSDKDSERPMLTSETVKKNLETYIEQASKIIDISKTEIKYNSEWLSKLGYAEIGTQADVFSLSDFISRDNIKKRLDAGKRISLRELLYPLMQGYDSVEVKSDLEIGGTDQKFNLLAGRDLQRAYGQEPQDILTNPIIEGLDGRKMSSSFGNTVNLMDNPNDMYGKIMSLNDSLIFRYFTLVTRIPLEQIDELEQEMKKGENPKIFKMRLAREVVTMYHNEESSLSAERNWESTFSEGKIPKDVPTVLFEDIMIVDCFMKSNIVASKSEFTRLIAENAIKIIDEEGKEKLIVDKSAKIEKDTVYKIGKKRFLKII